MNFKGLSPINSSPELQWYWNGHVTDRIDFSNVKVFDKVYDFTKKQDFFDLTDVAADRIAFIGRRYEISDLIKVLPDFRLEIFGDITLDSQIGGILSNISRKREEASVYGLFASFCNDGYSIYCAFTICYVDKDFEQEMDTAVVEIGQDEGAYIMPVSISEDALYYYTYDDLANIAYWLGNFWAGTQYEMYNCPEEVRVVEERGPISGNDENYKEGNHIVLVKRVVPVDEFGKEIKYGPTGSGRQYRIPSWGVRGHMRTLADGRQVPVRPYRKGKDRDKEDVLTEKEYRYIDEKIDLDI